MQNFLFSDFKSEIEKIGLTNPKVKIGASVIKIISQPSFSDLIDLLILLIFSSVFLFESSLLALSVPCFALFWHRLFLNFRGCGIIQIDLNKNLIITKNRFSLIQILRKAFGINSRNRFSSIKNICYVENSLIDKWGYLRLKKRYFLLLETIDDMPIAISQFDKEKEAKELTNVLRKFLLNKEKIIA